MVKVRLQIGAVGSPVCDFPPPLFRRNLEVLLGVVVDRHAGIALS